MAKSKKERTVEIQKSFETRERFPISYFDSRKYIQHNVLIEDGLAPILAFMDALPPDRTKVEVFRCFEDGDYSVAHAVYELGDWGKMVGFEIHRWEQDRIVEHWDNLQPSPANANSSGRTMTDGAHKVIDLEQTHLNKLRVEEFTTKILIGRNTGSLRSFFQRDMLIQHSSLVGDGVPALIDSLSGGVEYARLHRVLGEGNMVLAVSEGSSVGDNPVRQSLAIYDLYRLVNGHIAEHWDVIEAIAPREAWKNSNGKF